MILTCPTCLLRGERKNLAEILPDGIKIIRSINGEVDYTLIKTKEFSLICGNCQSVVYYQEPRQIFPTFDITIGWGTIYSYYAKGSNIW